MIYDFDELIRDRSVLLFSKKKTLSSLFKLFVLLQAQFIPCGILFDIFIEPVSIVSLLPYVPLTAAFILVWSGLLFFQHCEITREGVDSRFLSSFFSVTIKRENVIHIINDDYHGFPYVRVLYHPTTFYKEIDREQVCAFDLLGFEVHGMVQKDGQPGR